MSDFSDFIDFMTPDGQVLSVRSWDIIAVRSKSDSAACIYTPSFSADVVHARPAVLRMIANHQASRHERAEPDAT